ncbi:MAG TPA: hypothetical protein PKD61_12425 [Polyangiaceae bacterium]|nr:hypothetical protein [Polyangiaceae bacterium]
MASKRKVAHPQRVARFSDANQLRAAMLRWAKERWAERNGRAPTKADLEYFRGLAQPWKQTDKATERSAKAAHADLVKALHASAKYAQEHQSVVGWEGAFARLGSLVAEIVDPQNLRWQRELEPSSGSLKGDTHAWPARKTLIFELFGPTPDPASVQGWRFSVRPGAAQPEIEDVVMVCLLAGFREGDAELTSLWHRLAYNPTLKDGLRVERKAAVKTIKMLLRDK